MNIIRFLAVVDSAWKATITCEAAGPAWRIERALRKVAHTGNRLFPFPPADEMPSPGELDAKICNDLNLLDDMYGRIVNRKPVLVPQSDIEVFGRYLFRALLGNVAWQTILKAADAAQADSIELALSWAPTERDLHRLNWEMMHGPDGFLARGRRDGGRVVPIGIVRMVQGSTAEPRQLSLPPRLLFVVHSDVADDRIRPAAEIMGLIERLERDERGFHREVLRNASAKLLRDKVKAFQPDVVHFICHGETDQAGRGYLLLKDEKQEEGVPAYADQLVDLISAGNKVPPIVVLSACKSGGGDDRTVLGAHAVAPLAAELVQSGVPVVVGMAGRIADRACRLFTLGFGTGLLSGTPLLAAITAGRCASFAEGAPPHKNADWAFPAVFLSPKVPANYIAAQIAADDPALRIAQRLRALKITRAPVFCARDEFFDAYNALLGAEAPVVLGIHVEKNLPGFGRTRLLLELAGQAVRDGHLPLVLTNERPDGTLPKNTLALALEVLGAADIACQVLQIPPIDSSQVVLLNEAAGDAAALLGNDEKKDENEKRVKLDTWVKREVQKKNAITDRAVKLALQSDLALLAQAFREKYPPAPGPTPRVVVLLNRVELFGETLTTAVLSEWTDIAGLGTPTEPVPLIFTFALGTAADHIFNRWIAETSTKTWMIERPLKPFASGEDMLAYQRVFMNPFRGNRFPGVSDRPLAISDDASAEKVNTYEKMFRLFGKGMPGSFAMDDTFALAEVALADGFLVEMQDYKWFEELFARK